VGAELQWSGGGHCLPSRPNGAAKLCGVLSKHAPR
jgi:hypothetical protein